MTINTGIEAFIQNILFSCESDLILFVSLYFFAKFIYIKLYFVSRQQTNEKVIIFKMCQSLQELYSR